MLTQTILSRLSRLGFMRSSLPWKLSRSTVSCVVSVVHPIRPTGMAFNGILLCLVFFAAASKFGGPATQLEKTSPEKTLLLAFDISFLTLSGEPGANFLTLAGEEA